MPRIVVVSENSIKDIHDDFGVDLDRMRLVPVGVDPELFQPLPDVDRAARPADHHGQRRRRPEGPRLPARGDGQAAHRARRHAHDHRPARSPGEPAPSLIEQLGLRRRRHVRVAACPTSASSSCTPRPSWPSCPASTRASRCRRSRRWPPAPASSPPTAAPCPRSPAATARPCCQCPAGDADALAAAIRRGLDDADAARPRRRGRPPAGGRAVELAPLRRAHRRAVPRGPGHAANVAKLRRTARPALMLTVRYDRARPAPRRPPARPRLRLRPPRLRGGPARRPRRRPRLRRRRAEGGAQRPSAAMADAGEVDADALRRRGAAATPPACRSPTARSTGSSPSEVLEHIPDDAGALAELARVLRPGRHDRRRPCRRGCPRRSAGAVATSTTPRSSPAATCASTGDRAAGQAARRRARRPGSPTTPTPCTRRTGGCAARSARRTTTTAPSAPTAGSSSGTSSRRRRVDPRRPTGCSTRCSARASSSTPRSRHGADVRPRDDRPRRRRRAQRRRGAAPPPTRIAALQLPDGHDPVVPRRPLRPVEPRRDGDGARRRRAARRGRAAPTSGWPTSSAPTASWHNYYLADGVEDAKLDTNVCAYVATGVWHHWLSPATAASSSDLWPIVERAIDWVLVAADRAAARSSGPGDADGTPVDVRAAHRVVVDLPTALRCAVAPGRAGRRATAPTGSCRRQPRPTSSARSPTPSSPRTAGRWTGTTRCWPASLTGDDGRGPAGRRLGHVRDGRAWACAA